MTKPRILLMANNRLGYQVAEWLRHRGEHIIGALVHPPHNRTWGTELAATLNLPPECVLDGSRLHESATADAIRILKPDIGISILFGYIVPPHIISLFPRRIVNLHPSYLPYNRGPYPNVWSIVEGTAAGVTIHYMDEGVDTGEVLAQTLVEVEPVDTGESLYRKLEQAGLELFRAEWPRIREGHLSSAAQDPAAGTSHRLRDVEIIDRIDLDRTYTARDLLNLLRARTFPPYKGAFFEEGGRRVYLRLGLDYADAE